jgi:hypothetical protein
LHTVSLFEFRADGLDWPQLPRGARRLSTLRAHVTQARGFHVVLWREGDLGYALVSDADSGTLLELGQKLGMR